MWVSWKETSNFMKSPQVQLALLLFLLPFPVRLFPGAVPGTRGGGERENVGHLHLIVKSILFSYRSILTVYQYTVGSVGLVTEARGRHHSLQGLNCVLKLSTSTKRQPDCLPAALSISPPILHMWHYALSGILMVWPSFVSAELSPEWCRQVGQYFLISIGWKQMGILTSIMKAEESYWKNGENTNCIVL